MNVPLVVLLAAACAGWGLYLALRLRRRRHLVANRPRAIEESLKRAKAKQSGRRDGGATPTTPTQGDP